MSIQHIAQKFLALAAGLLALSIVMIPPALADGTETLGVPSISINSGTGVIVSGTGLAAVQPGTIAIDVPAGSTVQQVLLYWEGRDKTPIGDDTIVVNGTSVTGSLIGGPILWSRTGVNFGSSYTYRADITNLNLVSDGPSTNAVSVGGLSFNHVNNGAGVTVIVDDGSPVSFIEIRDGNDLANDGFFKFPDPLTLTTVPQTFMFPASSEDRIGTLSMHFSAVSGTLSGGGFRPSAIDITIGGVTVTHNNLLNSNDGEEWDTVILDVPIPAGESMVAVQAFSEDRVPIGGNPASFVWNVAALSVEPPPAPTIEICTLVTLNPDMVSDFSDADAIVGDGCDAFDQSIPVGVVGTVDGTYMLKVTNTGTEILVNVRINAPNFGLVNEPIPALCGDLDPGEMCLINLNDPNQNYSSLKILNVCTDSGQVIKMATADGEGQTSGLPVSDDDPASVQCVVEPHITLLKEVSLAGGPFLDANTVDTGPSGPLGADAEYRLTVENDGTETLTGAVITDATLGLVDVPVPGGPLLPGDVRVITQGTVGFGALLFPNRCDSVGNHINIARVDATGELTVTPVSAEDPANVSCENPLIELLKQVSIDGINFFDADLPTDPDVPVGIVGLTDATYRLIVKNIGSETLTNVVINDSTLGLVDVLVTGGPLMPSEMRTIATGDIGFGNLFQQNRCEGMPGNKSNIATVDAIGEFTGTPVSDDDPANVRCILGPAIALLKQVSLTGGDPFFDADTAAEGPTGLLGADATYRIIVKNIGDEDLTDVEITDSTLGISGAMIADLPIGAEVILNVGSFGGALFFENRCDAIGEKLNTAEVNAKGIFTDTPVQDNNPAYVNCDALAVCNIAVDKTCLVAPPSSNDQMCTAAIAATTLRYTGMSLNGADVTLVGKKDKDGGFAEYTSVDLVSGTTILTMAGQNGFTIDAGLGNMLGSKMTITINGVEEIIHTSCSAIYVAGQPAPLDGNTPNPPGASKGDPSPNWSVVNFRQKDGGFIEEPTGGQSGANACTVPFGGAEVSYEYTVMNTGTTNVDVTSVLDDILGERLTSSPAMLGPSDTLTLSGGPVFIDQDTTNVVNVSANVSGDFSAVCLADDTVEVTVEPPPALSCQEIKPITQLSMVWNGASGVDVLTEGGQLFSNVQSGNQITFDTAGLGNDVDLTFISGAASGASTFHVSCSDSGMNGPEDCGSNQGNGKKDNNGSVNDWLLDAMIGQDGAFICDVPSTGVVDPTDGGGVDAVRAELKEIKKKEYKLNIINNGNTDVIIERITISWPTATNGDLKEIKAGGTKIYDTDTSVSSTTITSWIDKEDKRQIKAGKEEEFKVKFKNDADTTLGNYSVEIEFDTGSMVAIP